MSIATAFDLGDLGNSNNPFVDIHARYDGSDWFDPVCEHCDGELDEAGSCKACEEEAK